MHGLPYLRDRFAEAVQNVKKYFVAALMFMTDLTFEPLIPSSLWLALAVAGAVVLAWYVLYRPPSVPKARWGIMIVFMSGAFALVLTLLLNPTWAHQVDSSGGKPLVTVLMDDTESMATPDATGGVSRFAAASQAARDIAGSLGADFDVRVETFDQSVKPVDPADLTNMSPTGSSTDV